MQRRPLWAVNLLVLVVLCTLTTSSCTISDNSSAEVSPSAETPSAVQPSSSATPSAPVTPIASSSPTIPVSKPPCAAAHGFTPAQLQLKNLKLALPIVAESLATDGTFPVPPDEAKWKAAWWRNGAKPGSGHGTVHIGVHTYTYGGNKAAAGNVLGNYARVDDLIKLLDKRGAVRACYRVTAIKTWSKGQVPIGPNCMAKASVCRLDGPPRLAIEFCWDKKKDWGQHNQLNRWRLRRYVLAEQVK